MSKQSESTASKSIWRELAEVVDAYAAAWDESQPQQIQDFVPSPGADHRRLAVIELIKVEMHKRLEYSLPHIPIKQYIDQWPEVVDEAGVPGDLLFEEIQVRRQSGESVDFSQYTEKFPAAAVALTRMNNDRQKSGLATTAMLAIRRAKSFKPGETVDDFELISELGKGGFATVYLARQKSMQRLVALKISSDQGAEPQTLAQLDHPNIVRVYDQRQILASQQRLLYMQFVAGGTLYDALNRLKETPDVDCDGKRFLEVVDRHLMQHGYDVDHESSTRRSVEQMEWAQVVARIGRQLANALDYAHSKGVLHRDLKPANVLLTPEGTAKLVDFNISFCSKVEGASPAAYFGGSLPYMSPEQIEACNPEYPLTAEALDERSDIFSLGILLFELLTGTRPYPDPPSSKNWTGVLDVMAEQRQLGMPRSKVEESFGEDELLKHTIMKCLEPLPERRFQSGSELAEILANCESGDLNRLLFTRHSPLFERILSWVIPIVILCAVIPSAAMALFVKAYNNIESIDGLTRQLFDQTVQIINGVAFPIAMIMIVLVSLPIAKLLRLNLKQKVGELIKEKHPKLIPQMIGLVPRLPTIGALVCITEWTVAGFLYPLVLSYRGADLGRRAWIDFIGSHALAGLVVAAYTFFGIAFVTAWCWLPRLFGRALIENQLPKAKPPGLIGLNRQLFFYQMISAVIPLASLALLVFWGEARNQFALGVLSLTSLFGVALLFWLARKIQIKLAEYDPLFAAEK